MLEQPENARQSRELLQHQARRLAFLRAAGQRARGMRMQWWSDGQMQRMMRVRQIGMVERRFSLCFLASIVKKTYWPTCLQRRHNVVLRDGVRDEIRVFALRREPNGHIVTKQSEWYTLVGVYFCFFAQANEMTLTGPFKV